MLLVKNDPGSIFIDPTQNQIIVTDMIPLGLDHIHVDGSFWKFAPMDHIGPTFLAARFVGTNTIAPGSSLPPISITGRINRDALTDYSNVGVLVNTATLTFNDVDVAHAIDAINVQQRYNYKNGGNGHDRRGNGRRGHRKERTFSSDLNLDTAAVM